MTMTATHAAQTGVRACQQAQAQRHQRVITRELAEVRRGLGGVTALLPLVAAEEAAARRRRAQAPAGRGRALDTAGLPVALVKTSTGRLVHAVRLADVPAGHVLTSLLAPADCLRDAEGRPLAVLGAADPANPAAGPPATVGPLEVVNLTRRARERQIVAAAGAGARGFTKGP